MPISYAYRYNSANQRDRVTLADNSLWDYTYDDLGQVTSGKHKWQDGTFVAGQQYEYTFDEIGNRTQTKVGGDASGGSLRSASYTPNRLNQYDSRTVSGYADVLGLGVPSSSVTVNANTAYRKGEYFHYPLSIANSGTAQYPTVTVVSGSESSSGKVFVPKTPEVFIHDLDGNLTSDGRWNYTWDAENRLVKIESLATGPSESRRRLEFAYDYLGRRIWKKVTNLYTNAVTEERFLYDGWNLVAVLEPSSATLKKSFVWGTDLSGSFQGAGGVGGLLKVNQVAAPASAHFVAYDGNGNVAALINAADGSPSAQYEYGPFGEVLRATGPMAKANPFRFSTKYQDDETDFLYYGYRYYNASTGRWLSGDPIGEKGGVNLYALAANEPLSRTDSVGLLCNPRGIPFDEVVVARGLRVAGPPFNRVSNMADVVHAMSKITSCQCIRRLTIVAHGGEWGFSLDANSGREISEKFTTNDINKNNAAALFGRLRNYVCFCKPCSIVLLSCEVGKGEIGNLIAGATGCLVVSPRGFCTPNPLQPHLSDIHWHEGPDWRVDKP
jgi:RHS repeat-associated protein